MQSRATAILENKQLTNAPNGGKTATLAQLLDAKRASSPMVTNECQAIVDELDSSERKVFSSKARASAALAAAAKRTKRLLKL